MNREILYRGKRVDNGEWVEGVPVKVKTGKRKEKAFIISAKFKSYDIFYDYLETSTFEVTPSTVGQYTGLTDENGRKIFEGDVIEYHTDYDDLDGFTKDVDVRAVVVWNNDCASFGCIIVGGEPDEFFPWFEMREEPPMTVIGNIHDNPELMKGER